VLAHRHGPWQGVAKAGTQIMKAFAITLAALVATALLHADELHFQFHRFGHIAIETTKGKESVIIETYDKEPGSEQIIFKSRLIPTGDGSYITPNGTVFAIKHLRKPIINDGNRHINSGDLQLTVSGKGKEFARLKPKMPTVAFGDTPPLVYLGEKAE
jgi:hypothetical protein